MKRARYRHPKGGLVGHESRLRALKLLLQGRPKQQQVEELVQACVLQRPMKISLKRKQKKRKRKKRSRKKIFQRMSCLRLRRGCKTSIFQSHPQIQMLLSSRRKQKRLKKRLNLEHQRLRLRAATSAHNPNPDPQGPPPSQEEHSQPQPHQHASAPAPPVTKDRASP